jgi:heme A synthase
MFDDTWLQMNRKAAMASTGAPRSSQSWRMCTRGSSPRAIDTSGLRNPSPISESTRIAPSTAWLRRAVSGTAGFAAATAAGAAAGASLAVTGSTDLGCADMLIYP